MDLSAYIIGILLGLFNGFIGGLIVADMKKLKEGVRD